MTDDTMKRPLSILTLFSLLIISVSSFRAQTINDPAKVLPADIDGWKMGTDRFFNNETLYNYIDGGAELFLSFGFSKVFNRIYSNDKNNEIIVDIFYMNKPEDAYGAFLFTSGKVDSTYGCQSQLSPGAVIFWKNNFYISLTSNRETEESNKLICRLAGMLDKAIPEKGLKPKIFKYLPSENIDEESIRYFRHYIWLNTHFFLSNDDILNINQKTEGITAKYGTGESKAVLILIEYPADNDAKTAFEKFLTGYNKDFTDNSVIKTGETWAAAVRTNKFFIGIFNGKSEARTRELLTSAINKATSLK